MDEVACVVPARMKSNRFPGKPLAKIQGVPMVIRTLQRAQEAQCFGRIICATDSALIAQIVKEAGFEVMLSPDVPTGSDRVAWVAQKLNLPLVINLQGDEPGVDPHLLKKVSTALKKNPKYWITVASPLSVQQSSDVNCVKVQIKDGFATSFTWEKVIGEQWYLHYGIYGYALPSLTEFFNIKANEAEKKMSIEPLRILNRRSIKIVITNKMAYSVDIPQDLLKVADFL